MKTKNSSYFLLCIIVLGFIMRVPIASISPVLGLIKGEYGMSNSAAGVLTTIPLAVFAVCSPLIPWLGHRLRRGTTIVMGALIVACGIIVRAYLGLTGLYIGTVLIALGIVIQNVLVPAFIKWKFPDRSTAVTGMQVTAMTFMIAVASGIGGTLAERIGWSNTTAIWAVLPLIALFVVLPVIRALNSAEPVKPDIDERLADAAPATVTPTAIPIAAIAAVAPTAIPTAAPASIVKRPMAWWITLYFGLQSFLFFCTLSWLPTILASRGLPSGQVGYLAFAYMVFSLPTNFVIPLVAGKLKNQKLLGLGLGIFYLLGFILLLTAVSSIVFFISVALLGLCAGGFVSLVFACRVLRCRNDREVERLAGMSESVGFLLSATGPTLMGAMADLTGGWQASIAIMTGCVVVLTLAAWMGGRNTPLFGEGG